MDSEIGPPESFSFPITSASGIVQLIEYLVYFSSPAKWAKENLDFEEVGTNCWQVCKIFELSTVGVTQHAELNLEPRPNILNPYSLPFNPLVDKTVESLKCHVMLQLSVR